MGCPKQLYKLISKGKKNDVVTYMDTHKMTPLYFLEYNIKLEEKYRWADPYYPVVEAAKHGHLDIMNTLIGRGFDPDNQDIAMYDDDWGPIQWACRWGHLHIVKCLIEEHDIDVTSKDMDEDGLAWIAAERDHIDVLKYLVSSGATVNERVLHNSIWTCGAEIIQYILSMGVDVNARDVDKKTPLFQTAPERCIYKYPCVLALLDAGADIDARDKDGNTTLLRVAQEQDEDLMQLLISRGADPNVVNNNGDTILHMAFDGFSSIDYHATKYLVVELGLDCLNTRNSRGLTPTAMALDFGCEGRVFELLVNYGCNITDEFDLLDDNTKQRLKSYIPNCTEFFQQLKQRTPQPRSLQDLVILKLRRHFGVHLESVVGALPLPEIIKNLVRIKNKEENNRFRLYRIKKLKMDHVENNVNGNAAAAAVVAAAAAAAADVDDDDVNDDDADDVDDYDDDDDSDDDIIMRMSCICCE